MGEKKRIAGKKNRWKKAKLVQPQLQGAFIVYE